MYRILFFAFISIFSSCWAYAQTADIKTDTFTVGGNCNMCKKRIENAAYLKGVKRAEWNKDQHLMTVIYKPSKTNALAIQTAIAKAGHGTRDVSVKKADYEQLPECCQYETQSCNH
jgi:hypothetical protein